MTEPITLQAIFAKAQTTVDGGWRVSLDVAENESKSVSELAKLRGVALQLAIVPIEAQD